MYLWTKAIVLCQNSLCDVWVAPIHEVGVVEILCRTHLGHLLSPGDQVWGFNLEAANCNDTNLDLMKPDQKPTVVSQPPSLYTV